MTTTTIPIPKIRLAVPQALLIILALGTFLLGGKFFSSLNQAWSAGIKVDEATVAKRCADFFSCVLIDEINKTDKFLSKHKDGLPYTKDPRDIQPYPEVVRLNIDTQALGYLNLYKLTSKKQYRREAEDRLNFILQLGPQAYRQTTFDGQLGYSFLYGYELTGNQKYFDAGMAIADRCRGYTNNTMNGGYMCAMNLGKAYTLTGNNDYLVASRKITRDTSDKQFSDGSFPHLSSRHYGKNTGYTSWVIYEMFQHRRDDVNNPDMDNAILKAIPFMTRRLNADGSLNYEDAAGTYYADPGNLDGRGWLSDVASMAYNLRAAGKNTEAEKLLTFLFQHQLTDKNTGSYPDKWMLIDPAKPITAGNPSVLRTSLIFWYLTSIPLIQDACQNGTQVSCTITPTNCNATFRDLGLCQASIPGHDVCLDGQFTKCTDEALIRYEPAQCSIYRSCTYYPEYDESQISRCTGPGSHRCIGTACEQSCLGVNTDHEECTRETERGDVCG